MQKAIFTCCVCGKHVLSGDKDAYTLQVRRASETSPEMLMSHGHVYEK
jgi:hypothetical protein